MQTNKVQNWLVIATLTLFLTSTSCGGSKQKNSSAGGEDLSCLHDTGTSLGTPFIKANSISPDSTLVDGNVYTVSGGNFGEKDPVLPITYDDFESGAPGASIHDQWPTVGQWVWNADYPENTVYTNSNSHGGSKSAFVDLMLGGNRRFGWINKGPYKQLFLSWWRYHESNPEEVLNDWRCTDYHYGDPEYDPDHCFNHKMMYLYGPGDRPQLLLGAILSPRQNWPYALQGGVFQQNNFYGGPHYSENLNKWQRWDTYTRMESNSSANDGRLLGWVAGKLYQNISNMDYGEGNQVYDDVRIGYMFRPKAIYSVFQSHFDDVYIDDTQARVEVCDQSTWNDSVERHCELQIPTGWSPGEVAFEANRGSFANGSALWLFVVNANGSVSSGYPVSFGASGLDTTPPVRYNGEPAGTLDAGTTSVDISLHTNESAACKYATSTGVTYSAMPFTFSSTGGTSHSTSVTGLSDGQSYSFYVRCQDEAGNANSNDFQITFSVDEVVIPPDTTPPVLSNGSPTGELPAGTEQEVLSLITSEAASCKYSDLRGVAYSSMVHVFTTTGGTSHSTIVSGLVDGGTYNYYVRCKDLADNANTDDYEVTFSVMTGQDLTPPQILDYKPKGLLPSGTKEAALEVVTSENAYCKYASLQGALWDSMSYFEMTGSTEHMALIDGLEDGGSYIYYVLCEDSEGNRTQSSYEISFLVSGSIVDPYLSAPPEDGASVTGGCGVLAGTDYESENRPASLLLVIVVSLLGIARRKKRATPHSC